MKVRATQLVFYDNRRFKVGEVFILKETKGKKLSPDGIHLVDHTWSPEDLFSKTTMEKVDGHVAVGKPVVEKKKLGRPFAKKTTGEALDVI